MKCSLASIFSKSNKIKIKLGLQFTQSGISVALNTEFSLPDTKKNIPRWTKFIAKRGKFRRPHHIKPIRVHGIEIVNNIGIYCTIQFETVFIFLAKGNNGREEKI